MADHIISPSSALTGCPANPTVTATAIQFAVSTVTVTNAASSTSYVFLPGSSPAPPKKKKRSPCKPSSRSVTATSTIKLSATSTSGESVSSTLSEPATTTSSTDPSNESSSTTTTEPATASSSTSLVVSTFISDSETASCPPTSTVTVTETDTQTSIASATVVAQPTKTVYPCANLIDFQGPAYGDAAGTIPGASGNTFYYLNDARGASPEACCNTCYFGVENCIQAYWYLYQGCVVSTAADTSAASGNGVSGSCPAGTFNGLTYGPDTRPAFRSTGNIAGPCGQAYSNFS